MGILKMPDGSNMRVPRKLLLLLLLSVLLSLIAVSTAYFLRQNPKRSSTDAWIPFRNLTVREAAILLKGNVEKPVRAGPIASINGLHGNQIVLSTTRYVLPKDEPIQEAFEKTWYKGMEYHLVCNSWENYQCCYSLDQGLIEKELGQAITIDTSPSNYQATRKISFQSWKIDGYFVFETFYLSLILFLFILFFAYIRNAFLFLPYTGLLLGVSSIVVAMYSPAFIDADYFHQRILIENFVPMALFFLRYFFSYTLVSLFLYVVFFIGKKIKKRNRKAWVVYLSAVFGLPLIWVAWGFVDSILQTKKAENLLSAEMGRVRSECSGESVSAILNDPAIATHSGLYSNFMKNNILNPKTVGRIKKILVTPEKNIEKRISIFQKKDEPQYLFLWNSTQFLYADFREGKPFDEIEVAPSLTLFGPVQKGAIVPVKPGVTAEILVEVKRKNHSASQYLFDFLIEPWFHAYRAMKRDRG